jgi:hypothetical protein
MALATFDPAEVVITIGGVPMSGYADGTFALLTRSVDAYSMVTGADGLTTRVKSNNRSGTLTLTLTQTSPSNDALSGFALLDELSNGGVVPIQVKDLSGTTVLFSATGWVRKIPDVEYSNILSNREWIFDLADFDMFVGGNPLV